MEVEHNEYRAHRGVVYPGHLVGKTCQLYFSGQVVAGIVTAARYLPATEEIRVDVIYPHVYAGGAVVWAGMFDLRAAPDGRPVTGTYSMDPYLISPNEGDENGGTEEQAKDHRRGRRARSGGD